MSFTFEKDFQIEACEQGGFVLTQRDRNLDNWYKKAFTSLEDLVGFLGDEKRKFVQEPPVAFIPVTPGN